MTAAAHTQHFSFKFPDSVKSLSGKFGSKICVDSFLSATFPLIFPRIYDRSRSSHIFLSFLDDVNRTCSLYKVGHMIRRTFTYTHPRTHALPGNQTKKEIKNCAHFRVSRKHRKPHVRSWRVFGWVCCTI